MSISYQERLDAIHVAASEIRYHAAAIKSDYPTAGSTETLAKCIRERDEARAGFTAADARANNAEKECANWSELYDEACGREAAAKVLAREAEARTRCAEQEVQTLRSSLLYATDKCTALEDVIRIEKGSVAFWQHLHDDVRQLLGISKLDLVPTLEVVKRLVLEAKQTKALLTALETAIFNTYKANAGKEVK